MKQAVKVAKIGKNALTATDPNDFIFHSSYNTFKIIDTGTVDFTIAASSTEEETLAHGLFYIPLVNAFMSVDTNEEAICANENFDTIGYRDVFFISVSSDDTNITFKIINNNLSSIEVHFRYYIFEVPF